MLNSSHVASACTSPKGNVCGHRVYSYLKCKKKPNNMTFFVLLFETGLCTALVILEFKRVTCLCIPRLLGLKVCSTMPSAK